MVSFFAEVKFFRFWPKTMDYNKAFYRDFLWSFYSTVEGAMKLKFAPFLSPGFHVFGLVHVVGVLTCTSTFVMSM